MWQETTKFKSKNPDEYIIIDFFVLEETTETAVSSHHQSLLAEICLSNFWLNCLHLHFLIRPVILCNSSYYKFLSISSTSGPLISPYCLFVGQLLASLLLRLLQCSSNFSSCSHLIHPAPQPLPIHIPR